MILSFKPQFIHPIQVGTKIHTIREDKTNRWKPGRKIDFYTGRYTSKERRIFAPSKECVSVQGFEVVYRDGQILPEIFIDGWQISENQIRTLSKNDGFEKLMDFFNWFNKDFNGKIIHWTDKNY